MSSQASSSSSSAAKALPMPHHHNLLEILRRANHHYSRVAAAFRQAYRPTHHAQKRAQKLKLTVSIKAALGLDPRQISVVPLPVLATPALVPVQPKANETATSRRRAILGPLRIPSFAVVGSEREIKRVARPALRCDIPQDVLPSDANALSSCVSVELDTPAVVNTAAAETQAALATTVLRNTPVIAAPLAQRGQNVPWRLVTSRWSMTESDIGDADLMTLADMDEEEEEEEEEEDSSNVVYSSDYEEGMDLEDSPSVITNRHVAAVAAGRVVFIPDARRARRETAASSRRNPILRPDAPMDIAHRSSWASDTSGSDTAISTGSPATPECPSQNHLPSAGCPYLLPLLDFQVSSEELRPKVTLRVKRKPSKSFIDMDDSDSSTPEKRPKYERKQWVHPSARRTVRPRTTSSTSFSSSGSSF